MLHMLHRGPGSRHSIKLHDITRLDITLEHGTVHTQEMPVNRTQPTEVKEEKESRGSPKVIKLM